MSSNGIGAGPLKNILVQRIVLAVAGVFLLLLVAYVIYVIYRLVKKAYRLVKKAVSIFAPIVGSVIYRLVKKAVSIFARIVGSVIYPLVKKAVSTIPIFARIVGEVLYALVQKAVSTIPIFARIVGSVLYALVQKAVSTIPIFARIVGSVIYTFVKKAVSTIPIFARIVGSVDSTGKDSNQVAIDVRADQFPVKVDFPTTIKGFLSNMAREKPIVFSPKQIAECTNNYNPANLLGSGAFGVVYKGRLLDGVEVAVKVLTNNNSAIVEEQFMAEVGTLGRICHMNLVRLYGFCFDPELKALVYEYMENGSLDKLLFDENKQVDLEKLHDIAVQIAQGLAYLHEGCGKRIIHYDIKPENVLLDENLNPKVADFGLAKLCNRGSSQMVLTNVRGTVGYAAPDVWKPYPVTHKCDVYSFGIVLFEIVGRRRHLDVNANESREWLPKWTWNMYNKNELAALVSRCGIEEKDKEKAERMFLVALLCIQNSPEARPIMSNVVKMLEGYMVIPLPPFPFEHGESPPRNLSQHSGTDEDSNTSASSTKTSEINEIELASV